MANQRRNRQGQPEQAQSGDFIVDPADVKRLDEMSLKWANLLRIRGEMRRADRQQQAFYKEITKLQGQELQNAKDYLTTSKRINTLEQDLKNLRKAGSVQNAQRIRQRERELQVAKAREQELAKTRGGSFRAQEVAAARQKAALQAERQLIRDINKERGLGAKIMDLFRSKEARQRQIDAARTKAGGGVNPATGGSSGNGGTFEGAAGANPYVAAALKLKQALISLAAPFKAIGSLAKQSITASFASAAQLLTGQNYGMGQGAPQTGGVGSILGGMQELARSIPLVGGLLGGLVGIFKSLAEAMLGIEQGIFRFARDLNVSYKDAERMRNSFVETAKASGHIAVNEARMMQSQVEISKQLGTQKQLTGELLANDVLLRDVLGVEMESRQAIADASIITGREATKLTKSLIGNIGAFNKLTGSSFTFKAIMQEASKLSGVIGLTFTKFPEKIARTVMTAKALGMEMQQLQSMGDGFLDFESSISKEMEAQVLTGRDMNLTLARQAALNNDYNTLALEITKNVGKTKDFLELTRIDQQAVAESVGLTADSLADVLKKQEKYASIGATDLKTYHQKIALMEKEGKTRQDISKIVGEDEYKAYTQLSTAERITEVLETMKRSFVELLKNTGIFDMLTDPAKVNNFIRAVANQVAGAIDFVGKMVATLLKAAAAVIGFFDAGIGQQLKALAATTVGGASSISGGIRASTANLGGASGPSIGDTMQRRSTQATTSGASSASSAAAVPTATTTNTGAVRNSSSSVVVENYMVIDGQVLAKAAAKYLPLVPGQRIAG